MAAASVLVPPGPAAGCVQAEMVAVLANVAESALAAAPCRWG